MKLDNRIVDYDDLIHLLKTRIKVIKSANWENIKHDATNIDSCDCHLSKTDRLGLHIIPFGALFFLVIGIGAIINDGLSISMGLLSSLTVLVFCIAIWYYIETIRKVTVNAEGITYYKLIRSITLPFTGIQSIRWKCIPSLSEGLLIIGDEKKIKITSDYKNFNSFLELLRKYAKIENDSDTVKIPMKLEIKPFIYWIRIWTLPAVSLGIGICFIYMFFKILDLIDKFPETTILGFNSFLYTCVVVFLILPMSTFCYYIYMRKIIPISIEFELREIVLKRDRGKSTVIPVNALEQIELVKEKSQVFIKISGAGKTINISSNYGVNLHFLHDALVRCYAITTTESEQDEQ